MRAVLVALLFTGIAGCVAEEPVVPFDLESAQASLHQQMMAEPTNMSAQPLVDWMQSRIEADEVGCWKLQQDHLQLLDANLPYLAALSFARDGCQGRTDTDAMMEGAKERGTVMSDFRAHWRTLNESIAGASAAFPTSFGSAQEMEFALGLAIRLASLSWSAQISLPPESLGWNLHRSFQNAINWNEDVNQEIWLTLNTYPWGSGCIGVPVHGREDVVAAAVALGAAKGRSPDSWTRDVFLYDFAQELGLSAMADFQLVGLQWNLARHAYDGPVPNATQMTALLSLYLSSPPGAAAQQALTGYFQGHVFSYEPIREHQFYDDGSDAHWGPILATLPELDRGDLQVHCDPNHI